MLLFYPHWLLRMIQHGMCFCPTFTPYVEQPTRLAISAFIRSQMPVAMSRDQIRRLRDRWPRHLVVKGIVNREEAQELAAMGLTPFGFPTMVVVNWMQPHPPWMH